MKRTVLYLLSILFCLLLTACGKQESTYVTDATLVAATQAAPVLSSADTTPIEESTVSTQPPEEQLQTYGEFCPTIQEYADYVVAITPVIDQWVLVADDDFSTTYAPKGYKDGAKGLFSVTDSSVILSKYAAYNSPRTFSVYYAPEEEGFDLMLSTDMLDSFDELLAYATPFLNRLPGALSPKELAELFQNESTVSSGVRSYITTKNAVTYTIHHDVSGGTTVINLSIDENATVSMELLEESTAPTQIVSAETTPTEASAATLPPESAIPYLQKIPRADQSIFSGPSYDDSFVGTVEVAGTYTIVEEVWDAEGNLWGKLKSGVGWVDLTDIRTTDLAAIPVSANYADDVLLRSGNYHHCIADTSEYTVQVAFRAYETVSNIQLISLSFTDAGYSAQTALYSLPELTPDKPLVADVAFPGDFSAYWFCFTDSAGREHCYWVSVSLRNNTLIFEPYIPQ